MNFHSSLITYLVISIGSLNIASGYVSTFDGKIAGNVTLAECINGGKKFSDSDMYITTSGMIRKHGYPVEEHVVLTEDGYLLTAHRIPNAQANATPVLVQHGLVASSFDWVVNGKGNALAFVLADLGYDVWLGNARGNTYSRCHTKYKTSEPQFWDFSFHELGMYDAPALVAYVTNKTNQDLIYIGHSMGCTMAFVMAIEKPEVASKVKAIFSMAPVAYLKFSFTSLRFFSHFNAHLEFILKVHGGVELFSQTQTQKLLFKYLCTLTAAQKRFCERWTFSISGTGEDQVDYDLRPIMYYHTPAGTSLKTFVHYYQVGLSNRFQSFDYGPLKNRLLYSSVQPPEYDLSKIRRPVALLWSDNDLLADKLDITKLRGRLTNVFLDFEVEYAEFNHLDFMWAKDAKKLVYDKLTSAMETFR